MAILSAIVAMSSNNVIGKGNALPWRMPSDLKRFKEITLGHPIIMGRKTFESILIKNKGPLKERTNLVVTSRKSFLPVHGGGIGCGSIEEAIDRGINAVGGDEIFIIGGSSVYRQSMSTLHRVYLTRICTKLDGDALFPEINWNEWNEIDERGVACGKHHPSDEFESSFTLYQK